MSEAAGDRVHKIVAEYTSRREQVGEAVAVRELAVALERAESWRSDGLAEQSEAGADAARAAAEITAQRDELLKALRRLESLHSRPDEGPNERFERIAEAFQRDTGYLRPGKDEPAASGGSRKGEREAAWQAWVEAICAEARAAIASTEGAGSPSKALPSQRPLMVEVVVMDGGEPPFISAVQGAITTDELAEVEKYLAEDRFFAAGKARGVYLCRPVYEKGQYDGEGRCELAPGWYIDGADRIAEEIG